MKSLLLYGLALMSLLSCSKGSDDAKDTQAPVVTLNSPNNNQVFTGSQIVSISGLVTDNKYIKEIHIEITNLVTAEEYLHIHIHPDALTSSFNQTFGIQAGKSYKIRVIAEDPSSNSSVQKAEIVCN